MIDIELANAELKKNVEEFQRASQLAMNVNSGSCAVTIAGAVLIVYGVYGPVSTPAFTYAGIVVMASAQMVGEYVVELLKKHAITQQKNIVKQIGSAEDLTTIQDAEKAQKLRPKVRMAMLASYITAAICIAFSPYLWGATEKSTYVVSVLVGMFVGYAASRMVKQKAQETIRFYDQPEVVAATVFEKVMGNNAQKGGEENEALKMVSKPIKMR